MAALNLSWITDELAVGGWFDRDQTIELVRDHRIAAVIDLREEESDDSELLAEHGIALLHLPTYDLCPVTPNMLRFGVHFAAGFRDQRLLVHCMHGIGRSALLALCILVDRGHTPSEALTIAKLRRPCVSPSPAQYEAWASWLHSVGKRPPTFDEFAHVMYRPRPALGA